MSVWDSEEMFMINKTYAVFGLGRYGRAIATELVKNGADPNFKDRMGMSSIDYATLFKKEEILNLYKERV